MKSSVKEGIITTITQTSTMSLENYLATLYPPDTPGELLVYVKEPFCRLFGKAANLIGFAQQIRQLDRQGFDVYLTINTLDGHSIRKRGSATRGTENEVVVVVGLVADVDAAGKSGHNYPPQTMILEALEDMPLQPTMVALSGKKDGGLHPYWLFPQPYIVTSEEQRKHIKAISVSWQRLIKQKLVPFEMDSTFDLVRVLRPVGTTNHKYETTVQYLLFKPDCRHRLEDFETHLPKPEPTPPSVVYFPPSGFDSEGVVERARRYISKIPGAIAGQGGHATTFHVACVLVLGFGLSVDTAIPILAEWNETCHPSWSERELIHKLQNADNQSGERGYMLREQSELPIVRRLIRDDSKREART